MTTIAVPAARPDVCSPLDDPGGLLDQITEAQRLIARTQAKVDDLCFRFSRNRTVELNAEVPPRAARPPGARNPAAFAAAELAPVLGQSSSEVGHLLARVRRLQSLPDVLAAARTGDLDARRVARIDRAARMVVHPETLIELDRQVIAVIAERAPTVQQLGAWLDRFLARSEPGKLAERQRRAHADRRVNVFQAVNAVGYVTGEVSAVGASAIDGRLSRLAWACGADDQRTLPQRRSDLFADLLLGRVDNRDSGAPDPIKHETAGDEPVTADSAEDEAPASAEPDWLEVERIDPITGEYLGTDYQPLDPDVEAAPSARRSSEPPPGRSGPSPAPTGRSASGVGVPGQKDSAFGRLPHGGPQVTVGVVVTLEALIGASETPAELWDRSATVPAAVARELAAEPDTLFVRLLTDRAGRLLDVTELGRFPSAKLGFAVRARSGSCSFPTCTRASPLCDLDHHEPVPAGPTTASNLGPLCRPHHNAKTFGHLEVRRIPDATLWTDEMAHRYRCLDEPLPTG